MLFGGWAADFSRDRHAHPELSRQEHATAAKVTDRLTTSGVEVRSGIGGTGVVGLIRNGDGPVGLLPKVDVASAQRVLSAPAGLAGTHAGPTLSAADSMRITVYGRGAHGSMPQASVDPVVLAAMIVVRLQTIAARETRPGEPVVVTVGSLQAGTKSNVIADHAVIELNVRTYSEQTRTSVLDAIRRIVDAGCQASGSPKPAEYELFDRFLFTANDAHTTEKVAEAFSADTYHQAEQAGRVDQDIPVNHSAHFPPVIEPTLDTGIQAMVVAALAWLASPRASGA